LKRFGLTAASIFYPEDGGSRLLWNAGSSPQDYTVSHLTTLTFVSYYLMSFHKMRTDTYTAVRTETTKRRRQL